MPLVSSTGPGAEDAALHEEAPQWSPELETEQSLLPAPRPAPAPAPAALLLTSYSVQTLWRTGWQFLKSYYT